MHELFHCFDLSKGVCIPPSAVKDWSIIAVHFWEKSYRRIYLYLSPMKGYVPIACTTLGIAQLDLSWSWRHRDYVQRVRYSHWTGRGFDGRDFRIDCGIGWMMSIIQGGVGIARFSILVSVWAWVYQHQGTIKLLYSIPNMFHLIILKSISIYFHLNL